MPTIKVKYDVHSTRYGINKALEQLFYQNVMSFDVETRGVYSKEERKEALELLKQQELPLDTKQLAMLVSHNNGLSFPSLIEVTHFVFGTHQDQSTILICNDPRLELRIWNWLSTYQGLLLVHNTLFDLKIMYNRVGKLPQHYEDTALLAKCLLNDVDTWRAKVGLKDLMAEQYDPSWTLIDEYEPENLKDPKFLKYAAIDGAATFKLYNDIQQTLWDEREERGENPF